MRRKILIIISALVLSFGFLIVVTSHIWIWSNFKELYLKRIQTDLPGIKKTFLKKITSKAVNYSTFDAALKKIYPDSKLWLWNSEFSLIFPTDSEDSKKLKKSLYNYIEELQAVKDKNEQYISYSTTNRVGVFFKFRNEQTPFYARITNPILSSDAIAFLIYLYVLVVLFTSLTWFVSFQFSKQIFSIFQALSHSMKDFAKNQYVQAIDYDSDDEIGNLIASYNNLIYSFQPSSNKPAVSGKTSEPMSDLDEAPKKSKKAPRVLLPRSDFIEISMFPKTLENNTNLLVHFEKTRDHQLHFLLLHTKSGGESDNWLDTVKDRFKGFVAKQYDPEKLVTELLNSVNENQKLNPGIFYGHFDPKRTKMSLLRTGHVTGFTQEMNQSPVLTESGSSKLPLSFTGFDEKPFSPRSYCMLFSSEMLQSLSISEASLQNEVLPQIDPELKSGKDVLKQTLEKILSIRKIALSSLKNLPGCVVLIFHKE